MPGLFVENLSVIDCAYLDAVRGLVGESWIVDLELEGDLDEQSMLVDFGEVKQRLKRALDASADHTLLVPKRAPGLALRDGGGEIWLRFDADPGPIEHRSPERAVTLVDAPLINADSLTLHLLTRLREQLPANVADLRLTLRPEASPGAYYQYVHGLRKHAGACQRIAHGHRSRIEIRTDGRRDLLLEAEWAERWADIYLGTRTHVVDRRGDRIRFAYRAGEGRFELELPNHRCEVLDGDTTVERIAAFVAGESAYRRRGARIEVRAYEGVMKGATASA